MTASTTIALAASMSAANTGAPAVGPSSSVYSFGRRPSRSFLTDNKSDCFVVWEFQLVFSVILPHSYCKRCLRGCPCAGSCSCSCKECSLGARSLHPAYLSHLRLPHRLLRLRFPLLLLMESACPIARPRPGKWSLCMLAQVGCFLYLYFFLVSYTFADCHRTSLPSSC